MIILSGREAHIPKVPLKAHSGTNSAIRLQPQTQDIFNDEEELQIYIAPYDAHSLNSSSGLIAAINIQGREAFDKHIPVQRNCPGDL